MIDIKINNGLYLKVYDKIKNIIDNKKDLLKYISTLKSYDNEASVFYLDININDKYCIFYNKQINRENIEDEIKISSILISDNFIINDININKNVKEEIESILFDGDYNVLYNYLNKFNKNNEYDIIINNKENED